MTAYKKCVLSFSIGSRHQSSKYATVKYEEALKVWAGGVLFVFDDWFAVTIKLLINKDLWACQKYSDFIHFNI